MRGFDKFGRYLSIAVRRSEPREQEAVEKGALQSI
jgi:hypothetical protein